ncbi:MAG: TIGR03617 family F420-dependent LLM class oxidoreductase [Actinomycetes bacterium]
MQLDELALVVGPQDAPAAARRAEEEGFAGWFAAETAHDPFLTLAMAATTTERITLGTGIAVAFARSPMDVAQSADDLQRLSGGRFVLGLGSQVQAHVTRRFSMPWSAPAARMEEFIAACKAIWAAWHDGTRLDFRGEFYEHTLMTPFFTPPPHGHGAPPVWLAAVGPLMTATAGRVADGLLCHSFTTERYLREVTLPALHDGVDAAGRDRAEVGVGLGVFVVSGHDEQERDQAAAFVRGQVAFYGSTPAYRRVLELHGWEQLGVELTALSKQGRWEEMAALVDDEVLDAFAVVADPADVGPAIADRFGDVVDRVNLYTTFRPTPDEREAMRDAIA